MSKGRQQSIILTGIGLIVLGIVILYFSLSQPTVSVQGDSVSSDTSDVSLTVNSSSASSAFKTTEENTYSAENTEVVYPINLNSCTADELMTVSGIGESKAQLIIEYRDYLGGYTSVEQIKNIKGIGDTVYKKISPYLTV